MFVVITVFVFSRSAAGYSLFADCGRAGESALPSRARPAHSNGWFPFFFFFALSSFVFLFCCVGATCAVLGDVDGGAAAHGARVSAGSSVSLRLLFCRLSGLFVVCCFFSLSLTCFCCCAGGCSSSRTRGGREAAGRNSARVHCRPCKKNSSLFF